MTHRSDAEASIAAARAQAIATAAVAQAILALADALTAEEPQR